MLPVWGQSCLKASPSGVSDTGPPIGETSRSTCPYKDLRRVLPRPGRCPAGVWVRSARVWRRLAPRAPQPLPASRVIRPKRSLPCDRPLPNPGHSAAALHWHCNRRFSGSSDRCTGPPADHAYWFPSWASPPRRPRSRGRTTTSWPGCVCRCPACRRATWRLEPSWA